MMNLDWTHQEAALGPSARGCLAACGATAEVLVSSAVQQALAPLASPGVHWRRAELANVWYTPPHRLMLVYRLEANGGPPRTACVLFGGGGASRDSYNLVPGQRLVRWKAQAWLLPQDPFGLSLDRWLGRDYSLSRLHPAGGWPPVPDRPADTGGNSATGWVPPTEAKLLSYLPGQRLAAHWPDLGVVLKHQRGASLSHRLMESIWNLPQRRFLMPRPLALDGVEDVRWEKFVPGHRLEVQAAMSGWPGTLAAVTRALVHLHQTSVPGLEAQLGATLPRIDPETVLHRLNGKVRRRLAHSLPGLAGRLDQACQALDPWLPEHSTWAGTGLIHGDLHTGNLLMQGLPDADLPLGQLAEVCFIDLDSLAQGHSCVDLALLASRLILQALLGQAHVDEVGEAIRQWPHDYARASGDDTVVQAYPWMLSAFLLARQLKTAIRHLAPDLDGIAGTLIDLSMAISTRRTVDQSFDDHLRMACERLRQRREQLREVKKMEALCPSDLTMTESGS